jgi:hypothetical protein
MSYQGLMAKEGDTATLLTLTGQDILGLPLAAPLAHYTTIYTLPMLTIKVVDSLPCCAAVFTNSFIIYCVPLPCCTAVFTN